MMVFRLCFEPLHLSTEEDLQLPFFNSTVPHLSRWFHSIKLKVVSFRLTWGSTLGCAPCAIVSTRSISTNPTHSNISAIGSDFRNLLLLLSRHRLISSATWKMEALENRHSGLRILWKYTSHGPVNECNRIINGVGDQPTNFFCRKNRLYNDILLNWFNRYSFWRFIESLTWMINR